MDWTTILGIILVIALIALYLYSRNRIEPQGTYDNKDYRSRGSIGGSKKRDYDDPDFRSGGSIGGDPDREKRRTKSYDSPDYKSGGSIGE